MYSLKFKKSGCDVEIAFGGEEALKKIRGGYAPDIVLLDIIMPAMDGIEILKKIRDEKLLLSSTIVMLTNQADDQSKVESLGIDGFIVKAMNIPSEVVTKVLDIYNKKNKQ
jgi:two-component system alkaline phosphatase synthesis response regulator PhoP